MGKSWPGPRSATRPSLSKLALLAPLALSVLLIASLVVSSIRSTSLTTALLGHGSVLGGWLSSGSLGSNAPHVHALNRQIARKYGREGRLVVTWGSHEYRCAADQGWTGGSRSGRPDGQLPPPLPLAQLRHRLGSGHSSSGRWGFYRIPPPTAQPSPPTSCSDFLRTWLHHVDAAGCRAYAVAARDQATLEWLLARNVSVFALPGPGGFDSSWFDPPDGLAPPELGGLTKAQLVAELLGWGLEVVLSDPETVWLRDPLAEFSKHPEADVLHAIDPDVPSVRDAGLEDPAAVSGWPANAVVSYWRPRAARFAAEWANWQKKGSDERHALDSLLKRGLVTPKRPDRLYEAYDRRLLAGVLSTARFCSGHSYYASSLPQRSGLECTAVHSPKPYSPAIERRHRLREAGFFEDEPSYYDHPVGFVIYDAVVPEGLLQDAGNASYDGTIRSANAHFRLVEHQLLQLRTGIIMADVLGRALVLPELWSGLDRDWGPWAGKVAGTDMRCPFIAPADNILDLPMIESKHSDGYRPRGFLELPGAATMASSALTIRVCLDEDDERCDEGGIVDDELWLWPQSTYQELALQLGDVPERFKVIRFAEGIERLLLVDASTAHHYDEIKWWTGSWCCATDETDPVFYDPYWDIEPHVARSGETISPRDRAEGYTAPPPPAAPSPPPPPGEDPSADARAKGAETGAGAGKEGGTTGEGSIDRQAAGKGDAKEGQAERRKAKEEAEEEAAERAAAGVGIENGAASKDQLQGGGAKDDRPAGTSADARDNKADDNGAGQRRKPKGNENRR